MCADRGDLAGERAGAVGELYDVREHRLRLDDPEVLRRARTAASRMFTGAPITPDFAHAKKNSRYSAQLGA